MSIRKKKLSTLLYKEPKRMLWFHTIFSGQNENIANDGNQKNSRKAGKSGDKRGKSNTNGTKSCSFYYV